MGESQRTVWQAGIHKGAASEPLCAPSAQDIKSKNDRREFFFLFYGKKQQNE